MNPTTGPDEVRHALVGHPDDTTISEADWPAYSAGYEAGLRAGIELGELRISVELVPVGPAHVGLKLWKATTQARLQKSTTYPRPGVTGEQLREQARTSWNLPSNHQGEQPHAVRRERAS
jgi:hypothetical protein